MILKIKQTFFSNHLGIRNWVAVVTIWLFISAGVTFCEFRLKKYTKNFGGPESDANKSLRLLHKM